MASKTHICQLALAAIGMRSSIASISESSPEARACLLQYDQALDDVLSAAHWNFARKQFALTVLKARSGTPENPTGANSEPPRPWLYSYAYPADCVHARFLMPLDDASAAASIFGTAMGAAPQLNPAYARFQIGIDTDADGNDVKVILTDQPDAMLVYTMRQANTTLYDPQFVRAMANYLGSLLALPTTGDKALWRQAFDVADRTTRAARVTNGNEGITVIDNIPDWMRVRGVESFASTTFIQNPIDLAYSG